MFKRGDRIHLHDGTVHTMKADGIPPRAGTRSKKAPTLEGPQIRGFVRGALVNPDGSECIGPWHENIVAALGHNQIVKNFAGLAGSAGARYWAIGQHLDAQSSNFSTTTRMDSEWGTNNASAVNAVGAGRADVNASQALAGAWTLSQSWQYPSSQISNNVVLNALGQCFVSTIATAAAASTGGLLSLATFASSSKSNSQALNVTYNWSFGTALLIAIALYAMMEKMEMLFY